MKTQDGKLQDVSGLTVNKDGSNSFMRRRNTDVLWMSMSIGVMPL